MRLNLYMRFGHSNQATHDYDIQQFDNPYENSVPYLQFRQLAFGRKKLLTNA